MRLSSDELARYAGIADELYALAQRPQRAEAQLRDKETLVESTNNRAEELSRKYLAVVHQLGPLYAVRRDAGNEASQWALVGFFCGGPLILFWFYSWLTGGNLHGLVALIGGLVFGGGMGAHFFAVEVLGLLAGRIEPLERERAAIASAYKKAGGTDDWVN